MLALDSSSPRNPPLACDLLTIRQEQKYAFDKLGFCADRGWRGLVADQSIHPHGFEYQDDSECRRGGGGVRFRATGNGIVGQRRPLPHNTMMRLVNESNDVPSRR
jgi:hypothetical protein